MSQPTTGVYFNSTDPPAPAGFQNAVPQSDGATPEQALTFYPQAATPDLLGVVKPDNVTTSVAADGTLSANPGSGGGLTNPMIGEIDIICPNPTTRGLVIIGSVAAGSSNLVQQKTSTQAAATSQPLAFDNPNTSGNSILVIATATGGGGGTGATCSDSNGNSYTDIVDAGINAIAFFAENIKAGANTVTYSSPYNSQGLFIVEFSGLAPGAFDTSSNDFGTAPQSTGNISTAQPDELLVIAAGRNNGGDPGDLSEANSFTSIGAFGGNGVYAAAWYGIAPPAASYSDTISSANTGSLWTIILALKILNPSATQIANPLTIRDGNGNDLSGINGEGQILLPVTAGLPTNTPNQPALAYDDAAAAVVLYSGGAWGILGGGGGGGSGLAWVKEFPVGSIDGLNPTFTLSFTPAPNSLALYRNGVFQNDLAASPVNAPLDYILVGNTITFTVPPEAGSQPGAIIAHYQH